MRRPRDELETEGFTCSQIDSLAYAPEAGDQDQVATPLLFHNLSFAATPIVKVMLSAMPRLRH
eukprot:CAMPEP_0178467698 /NCGR_PEP_ID=MMETSP0689_2-20121128/52546_1 /TAXON_ID=160604 /ORGANISM="Amphidinium massartii, Strain CS-259" /LENGTH=62 /DNA_ID=CAMNT_0020094747 /DNA_START=133 /DNA_END=321 /DNA_ORIENTATION=+